MVLNPQELSLNIKPTFIPKTISEFLGELSTIRNVSDKSLELDHYIKRLEDEMRKIDAFKRELPLSVLLINDAITALKEELNQCRKTNVDPVFEEFIPLKKRTNEAEKDEIGKDDEKKNWLSSVQLWSNTDVKCTRDSDVNRNIKPGSVVELVKKSEQENNANVENVYEPRKDRPKGMTFMPFRGGSNFPVVANRNEEDKEALPVTGLSLVTPGITKPRVEMRSSVVSSKSSSSIAVSSSNPNDQSNCWTSSQTSRKPRRCWSPELHRRFVSALQQLGGSQATPKLIRELMQVDGLTNDEVKSHLQKYRLHTRRSRTNKSAESALTLGSDVWPSRDGESSEQTHSKSSSPEGPLQRTDTTGRTSTTICDSKEDEEDERSESYIWKKQFQASGRVTV